MSLVYGGMKIRNSNVGTKRNQAEFSYPSKFAPRKKKTIAVINGKVAN